MSWQQIVTKAQATCPLLNYSRGSPHLLLCPLQQALGQHNLNIYVSAPILAYVSSNAAQRNMWPLSSYTTFCRKNFCTEYGLKKWLKRWRWRGTRVSEIWYSCKNKFLKSQYLRIFGCQSIRLNLTCDNVYERVVLKRWKQIPQAQKQAILDYFHNLRDTKNIGKIDMILKWVWDLSFVD